jgi:hypothetical protein
MKEQWVKLFIKLNIRNILFLNNSILILKNDTFKKERNDFIKNIITKTTNNNKQLQDFLYRAFLKYSQKPLKINLTNQEKKINININIYAYNQKIILIYLNEPNELIIEYFKSKLKTYVEKGTDTSLVINISKNKTKEKLDKLLSKKSILNYNLTYKYDNNFLSRLYSQYQNKTFGNLNFKTNDDILIEYYSILECPINSNKATIKKNYKKLIKAYHPDIIQSEAPQLIPFYTKKFQKVKEAYEKLK